MRHIEAARGQRVRNCITRSTFFSDQSIRFDPEPGIENTALV